MKLSIAVELCLFFKSEVPGVLIGFSDCTVFVFLVSVCITLVILDYSIDCDVIKKSKKQVRTIIWKEFILQHIN